MAAPPQLRWVPRPHWILIGCLLLGLLLLGLWVNGLHLAQVRFLNNVTALPGTYELRPVGWPWLRRMVGEETMRGWDHIVGLNLADTQVDGAWLREQRLHLRRLEWIDLNGTPVNREDLDQLAVLPNLNQLYLAETDVSDESLNAFSKSHPRVSLIRSHKAIKATKMARRPVKTHSTTFVRFSADGRCLATGNGEGELQVFDLDSRRLVWKTYAHEGWVFSAILSADGRTALTVGTDDYVRHWDVSTGAQLAEWMAPDGDLHAVRQDPATRRVYVAGDGGFVYVLDPQLQLIAEMGRHLGPIPSLDVSLDGKRLATVSRDDSLRLWDVDQKTEVAVHSDHTADVYAVGFSPDSRWLASGGYDNQVILRDGETGRACRTLTGHADWIFGVTFSADSQRLASGSGDGTIRVWDVESGKCLRILKTPKAVSGVDFQPGGSLLASSGLNGSVRLWDWETATLKGTLRSSR